MAKTNETRVDVELLLHKAVNKLEDKKHLDDVTFAYDDVPDPEHIILGKTDQIEAQSLIISKERAAVLKFDTILTKWKRKSFTKHAFNLQFSRADLVT